ncbi:peptide chain release factor H [Gilliamella sp. wkB108]|uniref:peptide chain release factor H n=1 Tax=Gilliamella sp. wkB108 TaxID=3120256 RepID=UPI00080E550E|nr:peptide chain release factor H [Gilliamella apicola]OCG20904.1 peptide chain release factor H [Gilliamella apicola]
MTLLYFSAAKGPDECTLAVAKAVTQFLQEASALSLVSEILEKVPGNKSGTYHSVLISIEGELKEQLIARWQGTLQWVCQSPYRPKHKRKNWFIGITSIAKPLAISDSAIQFTTTKSSGAGGQHVNKTESAVRATHLATGLVVKVQSERSQHANKRLAKLLLEHKLSEYNTNQKQQHKTTLHQYHQSIPRGDSGLVFYGETFCERKI